MKLQNLTVIFVIIMLPIILLFSMYTKLQIDILNMQKRYTGILNVATYDAVKAFKTNTLNDLNSKNAQSMIRDINASINTFASSINSGFGVDGQNKKYAMQYIPALVYTLYDGYYIYSPAQNASTGEYEHILKPYIYYTVRYQNEEEDIDVVVNYTLDNYIAVYGNIGDEYITKAGYLENPEVIKIQGDEVKYAGIEIEDEDAKKYYRSANEFTQWVKENLGDIQEKDAKPIGVWDMASFEQFAGHEQYIFRFDSSNDPRDESSTFNSHRKGIIKLSIQNNLNAAMVSYSQNSSYNFKMPMLKDNEWNQILSNISVIAFMQGIPMGLKVYNGYTYVINTMNKEMVTEDTVCYTDENQIHKYDCDKLNVAEAKGHKAYLFEKIQIENNNNDGPEEGDWESYNTSRTWAYRTQSDYRNPETGEYENFEYGEYEACYYCMVSNNYIKAENDKDRRKLMLETVAREKYRLYNKSNELNE